MKTLNNFILERLKLNKDSKATESDIKLFGNILGIEYNDAEWIYRDYYTNIEMFEEIYCDEWSQRNAFFTPFESLAILANMLIDDGNECELFKKLGMKSYTGDNNPYNWGVWCEENDNEVTLLEYVQYWIERKNFKAFKKMYDFLKNMKNQNAKIRDIGYLSDGEDGYRIEDKVPCKIKKLMN